MKSASLTGLIAATHTPFHTDGALNLATVEKQLSHLLSQGVRTVFIGGSTGESHSLTFEERRALSQRWLEVCRGTEMRVVVHVGSNCLSDAKALAAQGQALGATAFSALAPSYFKPRNLDDLIACAADIAAGAPDLPFYFYDIPVLTGVNFPMPEFLEHAQQRIPNLVGLKFTNPDLMSYQLCLQSREGKWDIPFGLDEILLAALVLGAKGAVGSSYNFAAPIYLRIFAAVEQGDLVAARKLQLQSVRLIQLLARYGYMGAAKTVMEMLGVSVGPARLPNGNPNTVQRRALQTELEKLGFFDWIR